MLSKFTTDNRSIKTIEMKTCLILSGEGYTESHGCHHLELTGDRAVSSEVHEIGLRHALIRGRIPVVSPSGQDAAAAEVGRPGYEPRYLGPPGPRRCFVLVAPLEWSGGEEGFA